MNAQRIFAAVLGFAVSPLAMPWLTGCDMPGRPQPGPEVPRPEAVASFDILYGENCAGCHGKNGDNGAATNLANPEYQGADRRCLDARCDCEWKDGLFNARIQRAAWWTADRGTDRCDRSGHAGTLEEGECLWRRDSSALQGLARGRCNQGPRGLCHGLRTLPRRNGPTPRDRRLDPRWIVPGPHQ